MSAAAAVASDVAPKKGKKKLLLIIVLTLLVLMLAGGGATVMLLKKQAAEAAAYGEDDEGGEGGAEARAPARDPKAVPTFVPLDMFTVNLADREAERYAQIGITLEVTDSKVADQIKSYMPAIRNNVLMVLAHKTSAQLLEREGKQTLAAEIRREALRPLGYELPDEPAEGSKPRSRRAQEAAPVTQVHFSNFIIQ
jgi:flagellar FliL protein